MTDPMEDVVINLDEQEALLAKATPLPFAVGQRPDGPFGHGRHFIKSDEHGTVCVMSFPDIGDDDDNAKALVGAINSLPSLITRIRKLEAVAEAARGAEKDWREWWKNPTPDAPRFQDDTGYPVSGGAMRRVMEALAALDDAPTHGNA